MNTFYAGQKVVCIARGPYQEFRDLGFSVPVRGGIYTIREIYIDPLVSLIGVRLEEIRNPHSALFTFPAEPGFCASEFRPVKETDISIFQKLLKPVKEYA
jgi:hypothetical protein